MKVACFHSNTGMYIVPPTSSPGKLHSYLANIPCWAIIGPLANRHVNGVSWRINGGTITLLAKGFLRNTGLGVIKLEFIQAANHCALF